jgi:undecaprenyl diphosphate synthase
MNWKNSQEEIDNKLQHELMQGKMPKHLAVIMDGNGRWATGKTFPRLKGHREGIESVRDMVKATSCLGIEYLTLYAFSIENWKRPEAEISGLMKLLETFLNKEIEDLHENNVRLNVIGKTSSLPGPIQQLLARCMERTKFNKGLTLTLALSYSGRWDITRAMQMMALDVRRGSLSPEDIGESTIAEYLTTKDMPEPDLMIRTSGEMRISNFLLWELAYSELYVSQVLWPDFRRQHLYEALSSYQCRERRFGKTSVQLRSEIEKDPESMPNINPEDESYFKKVVNAIRKNS